ncbi:hypothetical protein SASPL_110561 [Salvia splendens]|uniref:Uncharacterized protein n=1 Tax=Salvia splendens TaxID=180675 RepID=A0A8X8Y7Y3_SALSN|nr:hypothetical protein SASPL_110561 [Salvia splendens]
MEVPSRRGTDLLAEWVSKNDDFVRSLPIYVGGASLAAVLLNRAVSGIAPVADASRQVQLCCDIELFSRSRSKIEEINSRADLLTLGLAVTNILNGLVWLSIRPKTISVVDPNGVDCRRIYHGLPEYVTSDKLRMLIVVIYTGRFADVLQPNGDEPIGVDADKLIQGSLYKGLMRSGSQSYLANLSLYPGKTELPFLPSNTQAVILQPLGEKGFAIVGGDTIRGFTTSDQANLWLNALASHSFVPATQMSNFPEAPSS